MERIDFTDLRVFLTVVRRCSFKLAAIELGLSPSAVSHAIRRLEARVGVRLFNLTSWAVASTALGREFADRLAGGFEVIEAALETLNAPGRGHFGTLRINIFADAAHQLVTPALPAFAARFPGVSLTIVVDDRPVDITAEGFDAGVRYGHLVPEDMVAVPLTGPQRWVVAAAPDYLRRHGTPQTPADLAHHNCIQLLLGNNAGFKWEFGAGEASMALNVPGLITIKDTAMTIAAASAGIGLAYVLESRILAELEQGTLVRVLEAFASPGEPFHIYYSSRRFVHPALKALINTIRNDNGLMSLPES